MNRLCQKLISSPPHLRRLKRSVKFARHDCFCFIYRLTMHVAALDKNMEHQVVTGRLHRSSLRHTPS